MRPLALSLLLSLPSAASVAGAFHPAKIKSIAVGQPSKGGRTMTVSYELRCQDGLVGLVQAELGGPVSMSRRTFAAAVLVQDAGARQCKAAASLETASFTVAAVMGSLGVRPVLPAGASAPGALYPAKIHSIAAVLSVKGHWDATISYELMCQEQVVGVLASEVPPAPGAPRRFAAAVLVTVDPRVQCIQASSTQSASFSVPATAAAPDFIPVQP